MFPLKALLRGTAEKSTIIFYSEMHSRIAEYVFTQRVSSFFFFSNVKFICAERRTAVQAPSFDDMLLSFDRPPPFSGESLCEEVLDRFVVDNSIHVSVGNDVQCVSR